MTNPRLIVALIALAAVAYTAIWFRTADRLENMVTGQTWQAEGYDVSVASVRVTGFPARMRAEATDFMMTRSQGEKDNGLQSLSTPVLVVDSLPYKLNHLIFDFPEPLTVKHSEGSQQLTTVLIPETAHASVVFEGGGKYRASLESQNVAISRAVGDAALKAFGTVRAAVAHTRPTSDADTDQDVYVAVTDYIPAGPNANPLKQLLANLTITQAESFAQAWRNRADRNARLKDWADAEGKLTIHELSVVRGDTQFKLDGALTPEAETGYVAGDMTVNVSNYQAVLAAQMPDESQQTENSKDAAFIAQTALGLLDMMDGNVDGKVTAPLTAADGGLWFGPVRLTDLPRLFQP